MRHAAVLILVISILACASLSNQPPPQVKLAWDSGSDEQVVGFNVYRSEESGQGYERVNEALVPNPSYIDTTVERGKTYYYRVTSVSASGVESEFSEERSKSLD